MENKEIEIEGHVYRIGKLDAFKQFHLVRRLTPVFFALGNSGATVEKTAAGGIAGLSDLAAIGALAPVADVIAKLSDEESEYVVNLCLLVCQRKVSEGKWAPVKVRGAAKLQMDDITLTAMMQLVFAVIEENLGNFFPVPPAQA